MLKPANMPFRFLAFLAALLFSGSLALAESIEALSESGSTEFLAVGRPSMLRIRGKGTGPKGALELTNRQIQGRLEFDISSLSTGIEMRDTHMKEKYLEVAKFQKAVLTLRPLALSEMTSGELDFEGDLELHGVKKPVKGHVKYDMAKGGTVAIAAKFPLKITDYQINIPTYAGIKIADDVDVEVKSELKPTKR
jgi:polyisoprenoid-binding protein YceI